MLPFPSGLINTLILAPAGDYPFMLLTDVRFIWIKGEARVRGTVVDSGPEAYADYTPFDFDAVRGETLAIAKKRLEKAEAEYARVTANIDRVMKKKARETNLLTNLAKTIVRSCSDITNRGRVPRQRHQAGCCRHAPSCS